ncbi:hypothetical protein C1645_837652 [Glomus cerebriforme]|uniref:Uncharacterized protein n=1 Tax=Glomus cerebriforme TaxID=658196 RepID=A0A397SE55_9GLOM|nr:hypothetical protein C1645_837652 [Glomus cerebriforme]
MSPNKNNQVRRQQSHRSVKESNVNTVLGFSSHQRAKSPIPKSLTTSQLKESTSLDKDKEIITQTYGTSSNPASDEQQHHEDTSTSVTNPIMITTARRTNHCAIAPYDDVKETQQRKIHVHIFP